MPILTVDNLKKTYGRMEAVKGISFEVAENEIFSLIGPNGAGKSTTLKMIATILVPTSGTISVNGLKVGKDDYQIRKTISYLPEEAGAYKNLTGEQYLEFMASIYADDKTEKQNFLEAGRSVSGLNERLRDKVTTYSKGMARKLLLARTVMVKPKLAILDEPTSGLDIINALEVRKTIRSLASRGMSVLLSSHNMLEVELLSDRVAIIHQGLIRETGTPAELKSKYDAQNLEQVFVKVAERGNV
ncbi:MAG: ABC transporter ATP-binding protein [Acidobacteriaceae bacterium]